MTGENQVPQSLIHGNYVFLKREQISRALAHLGLQLTRFQSNTVAKDENFKNNLVAKLLGYIGTQNQRLDLIRNAQETMKKVIFVS
jgi:hypothetical protein